MTLKKNLLFFSLLLFTQLSTNCSWNSFAKTITHDAFSLWSNEKKNKRADRAWEKAYKAIENISPEVAAQSFNNTLNDATLPQPFMLGASGSHAQYEGELLASSSFLRWAEKLDKPIAESEPNFWTDYKSYIDDLASIGITTFRYSVSWERIQPNGPDSFDDAALAHYKEIFQYMKSKGIEPLVVLHHYTIPSWFEDLGGKYLGGFTNEANNQYFVNFAKRVYQELGSVVTYWSTCNIGYEFKAYRENELAPGIFYYVARVYNEKAEFKTEFANIDAAVDAYVNKTASEKFIQEVEKLAKAEGLQMPLVVKKNILLCHVEIYKAFNEMYEKQRKSNPRMQKPFIGIQTTVHPIMPSGTAKSYLVAAVGNWMLNHGLYSFFVRNRFETYIPKKVSIDAYVKDANQSIDFIGINVYDRSIAKSMSKVEKEQGRETATSKTYCPQAIAMAVEEVYTQLVLPLKKKTGRSIPIFITENGIDPVSEEQRNTYYASTLYTIKELIKKGYPIIGYTPWASHDNFEWGQKRNTLKYGLFGYDKKTQKSYLKNAENNYFARFSTKLAELQRRTPLT